MAIFKLINDGTPPESTGHNGARMTPWSQQLSPKQIAEVTAYLISENRKDFAPATP
jgi:mono/diheme cytochrome c family protein